MEAHPRTIAEIAIESGFAVALAKAISKATWRLVPFLLLMYILAFLDRANVGFAKESFQVDTEISVAAYAFETADRFRDLGGRPIFRSRLQDRGAVERGTVHNDERTVGADGALAFEVKYPR